MRSFTLLGVKNWNPHTALIRIGDAVQKRLSSRVTIDSEQVWSGLLKAINYVFIVEAEPFPLAEVLWVFNEMVMGSIAAGNLENVKPDEWWKIPGIDYEEGYPSLKVKPEPLFSYATSLGLTDFHRKVMEREPDIWKNQCELREPDTWENLLDENALFIVVGTWTGAELVDRIWAYKIAEEIHRMNIGRCPIVVSDREWWNISPKHLGVPAISIGGPFANSLSDRIAKTLGLGDSALGIAELDNRTVGYVWGANFTGTQKQVERFIEKGTLEQWVNKVKQKYLSQAIVDTLKQHGDNVIGPALVTPQLQIDLERLLKDLISSTKTSTDIRQSLKAAYVKICDEMIERDAPADTFITHLQILDKEILSRFRPDLSKEIQSFVKEIAMCGMSLIPEKLKNKWRSDLSEKIRESSLDSGP